MALRAKPRDILLPNSSLRVVARPLVDGCVPRLSLLFRRTCVSVRSPPSVCVELGRASRFARVREHFHIRIHDYPIVPQQLLNLPFSCA
jgi:hypothetical protein